ncbi:N-acetyltransferase family protein [Aequorivita sp. SDUM287046]|uniref:N-acetyltransferase family protein n=1 Tax=Aequorivita aurantiaca TaxID=3053356 RepID=A0ABT8DQV8_9FLAO|nr:GNAT family N-acetyltransferase [Aequorivita aurantiaca]MDN3725452.1 N-acetyltransferase family protein [Aequorivita aurantiaca]
MMNRAARPMAIAVNMNLINISEENYPEVSRIYEEGLQTGTATFETVIPNWEKWDAGHLPFGRIMAMENKTHLGWAALSPVSSRCVYGGVAEVSVYVSDGARGKGVGEFLLKNLIAMSEANNIWTLQSGIFRDNLASHKLHLKCGFREIGYKEKVGQLHGVWKDNVLLERRSKIVGI